MLRAADGQHRLPRRGGAGGADLRRRVRGVRRHRHAVGLVRRVGAAPALDRRRPLRRPRAGGGRRGDRAADLRAERVPRRRAWRDRRRCLLPAPGDLPPDLPQPADARRRRPAHPAARGRPRHRAGRPPQRHRVLRLRRHLRPQERRHVDRDGRRQGAARARHRRGGAGRRRQLLPDARRRDALAPASRRPRHAPRRDPRGHGEHRGRPRPSNPLVEEVAQRAVTRPRHRDRGTR